MLVTRVLREAKGRMFERFLAQKLKKYNVTVICAPLGMSRQKENRTTLNRKTGRINWQVEWMSGKEPQRYLSKVMDDVPIYQAYRTLLEEQHRQPGAPPKLGGHVAANSSRWSLATSCMQDPYSSTWFLGDGPAVDLWPKESKEEFRFYLARPQTRSDLATTLTLLDAEDCFRDILTDTRVLEFPTIYVFPKAEDLPEGFVLGPKDTAPAQGTKRKEGPQGKKDNRAAKKRRHGKDKEEGEVGNSDDGDSQDEGDDGVKGSTMGLEAGEVIAEQSFGEDDEDDDETSSSGSDSESD